jgi:malate dehydrogenase (quinone)
MIVVCFSSGDVYDDSDVFFIPKIMNQHYDIVLVGAGIMSATLATLLHELDPKLTIAIYEKLD